MIFKPASDKETEEYLHKQYGSCVLKVQGEEDDTIKDMLEETRVLDFRIIEPVEEENNLYITCEDREDLDFLIRLFKDDV